MNVHRRSTQAEEDKKAGRKPTRVASDVREQPDHHLRRRLGDGTYDDRFGPTVLVAERSSPSPPQTYLLM